MAARRRFEFYLHRDSCAVRFDFIYTEMLARRRFEFYLHRDGCAAAIRVLSTQRFVRRGDLILIDLRKNDDMFKTFSALRALIHYGFLKEKR